MNILKSSALVIVNGRIYTFRDAKTIAEVFKSPSDCVEAYLSIGAESIQKFDTVEVRYTVDDKTYSVGRSWWKFWRRR